VQKISFGSKDYVKASEAAKRFKYTQDYVGQLCRAKKIDARLVGRVWYVNLDSITEYRKTKHATQKKKTSSSKENKSLSRKSTSKVEPVVRPKTARYIQEFFPKEAKSAFSIVSVAYEPDDTETIPILKARDSKSVDSSKLTEGTKKHSIKLKVRPNTKKQIKFKANKIPEITLHSKIKVTNKVENLVPSTPRDVKIITERNKGLNNKNDDVLNSGHPHPKVQENLSNFVHDQVADLDEEYTDITHATQSSDRGRRSLFLVSGIVLFVIVTSLFSILILGSSTVVETGVLGTTSSFDFSIQLAIDTLQSVFD
jgi:hypothetical protein